MHPPRLAPTDSPAPTARKAAGAATAVPFGGVDIDVDQGAGECLVTVTGSLSYPLAGRLEAALDALDVGRDELLTIDLHAVTDIDSSGLAALLSAYLRARREGFDVRATRPPPRVERIFSLTGVDRWLTVVDEPSDRS
jgi:anti-sigma B factor antagonist